MRTAKWHSLGEYEKAKCLSGEPGAYYLTPGFGNGKSKVIFHLQGGIFCDSLQDCAQRAQKGGNEGGLTSTDPKDRTWEEPYYSDDNVSNPLLYNWNIVFMRYCDGGYFGSDVDAPIQYGSQTLYYRGMQILKAGIKMVMQTLKPTEVIVTGISSGAIADLTFADAIHDLFKAEPGGDALRVTILSESGFYVDSNDHAKGKKYVIEGHKVDKLLNTECKKEYASELWKCMVAEYMARYIKTPTFVWQSKYDYTMRIPEDATAISQAIRNFANRGHGAFIDSCKRHGWWSEHIPWAAEFNGTMLTPLQAHMLWYTEQQSIVLEQEETVPRHQDCYGGAGNSGKQIWQRWEFWLILVSVPIIIYIVNEKTCKYRCGKKIRRPAPRQDITAPLGEVEMDSSEKA